MTNVLFGFVAVGLGLWGMLVWRSSFIMALKGLLPVSLFFAGLVAVIVGLGRFSANGSSKPKDHGKA